MEIQIPTQPATHTNNNMLTHLLVGIKSKSTTELNTDNHWHAKLLQQKLLYFQNQEDAYANGPKTVSSSSIASSRRTSRFEDAPTMVNTAFNSRRTSRVAFSSPDDFHLRRPSIVSWAMPAEEETDNMSDITDEQEVEIEHDQEALIDTDEEQLPVVEPQPNQGKWISLFKKLFIVKPYECASCYPEKKHLKAKNEKLQSKYNSLVEMFESQKMDIEMLSNQCQQLQNEKEEILSELESLSQSLFEEANKMVSQERRTCSELNKQNEELKIKLEKTLTELSDVAAKSVKARRNSMIPDGVNLAHRGSIYSLQQNQISFDASKLEKIASRRKSIAYAMESPKSSDKKQLKRENSIQFPTSNSEYKFPPEPESKNKVTHIFNTEFVFPAPSPARRQSIRPNGQIRQ